MNQIEFNARSIIEKDSQLLDEANNLVETLNEDNKQLKAKITALSAQNAEKSNEVERLKKINIELTADCEDRLQRIDVLEKNIEDVKKSFEAVTSDNNSLKQTCESLSSENNVLINKYNDLFKRYNTINSEYQSLKSENNEARNEIESQKVSLEQANAENIMLNNELQTLQTQIEQLNSEKEELKPYIYLIEAKKEEEAKECVLNQAKDTFKEIIDNASDLLSELKHDEVATILSSAISTAQEQMCSAKDIVAIDEAKHELDNFINQAKLKEQELIEEEQRELLRGYLDGDGYQRKGDRNREFSMSTSSRHLAFGLARLIRNVYNIGVSIACCQPKDGITFIEGRKVNAHEFWHLSFTIPKNETKFRRSFYSDGFVWCPVKDVKELDEHIDVYNITVEDNHTYEANGICVHNCGVHSSNEGHDFQKVLEEITEASIPMPKSGSWSASGMVRSRRCDVSWRVLDAQYWGVPQRRRRIFLIADYRTISERRPEVFFVSKSLQGDSEESRGKGEGTSCTASKCFAISGHIVGRDTGNGGNGLGVCEEVAYTLTTVDRHAVCQVKSDSVVHAGFNMKASKTQGISFQPELSPTLQASKEMGVLSYDMTHADDVIRENRTDKIHTLNHRMGTGGNQVPLVQIYGQGGYGGFGKGVSTLRSSGGDCGHGSENLVMDSCLYDTQTQVVGAVRKLTPLECERLMGLPDNYTLIPHKSCSDSSRYKAIGNSMAVPCSDYIMWVVKEMYNNG